MESWVKSLTFDVIVKAAIQRLFLAVPFLGWGPIGLVVSHYIIMFADFGYDIGREIVVGWSYKFKNEAHQAAFDDEMIKLKMIEADPSATEEDIKNAIKKAQDKMAEFVIVKRVDPRNLAPKQLR